MKSFNPFRSVILRIKRLLIVVISVGVLSLPAFGGEPSVNINTASAQQIADALDGIGIAKAEAIVAYRNAKGPFKTRHGLLAVKGIGEATVERNAEKISIRN